MKMKRTALMAALAALAAGIVIAAETAGDAGGKAAAPDMPMTDAKLSLYAADKIEGKEGPKSLPPGAKFSVLEGDPAKDGPFTMRLRLPDGFKIPPHWHPKVEHVTVISGTFNLGMGEKFDAAATQELPPGTFAYWSVGMRHFAWAKGETVLQVNGVGPWGINYVNPADDPRNATK